MTIFTYLFFGILALLSTILDVSFFSFLPVAGSSILITFIIMVILASFELRYYSIIFAACAILFYAGLSSVPILYIMIMFVGIPMLVFYTRKRFLFELSYLSFLLIIVGSLVVLEIILLIIGLDFSVSSLFAAVMFVAVNALVGIILFPIAKRVAQKLKIVQN